MYFGEREPQWLMFGLFSRNRTLWVHIKPKQIFRSIGVRSRFTELRHSKEKYKIIFYPASSPPSPSPLLSSLFWVTDGNRKWAIFHFNLPLHNHIPSGTSSIKNWETIRSYRANCSLPVAVGVSKTRVLKFPNNDLTGRTRIRVETCKWILKCEKSYHLISRLTTELSKENFRQESPTVSIVKIGIIGCTCIEKWNHP